MMSQEMFTSSHVLEKCEFFEFFTQKHWFEYFWGMVAVGLSIQFSSHTPLSLPSYHNVNIHKDGSGSDFGARGANNVFLCVDSYF